MEEFKLILDFETKRSGSRRKIREVFSRNAKENAFWTDFRSQVDDRSKVPASTSDIHERLRTRLSGALKLEMDGPLSAELSGRSAPASQEEVRPAARQEEARPAARQEEARPAARQEEARPAADELVTPEMVQRLGDALGLQKEATTAATETATQASPSSSPSVAPASDAEAKREAISLAIQGLDFRVKSIGYGSLELILLVFGFTKLAEVAGIDREDFAKYLEVFTPMALNNVFGTNVALEANASPPEDPSSASQAAHSGFALGNWPALAYVVPALFALAAAGVVIYFGSSALRGVASSLVEERKMIAANLHDEMIAITADRGKLTDSFLNAIQKHEETTVTERKAIVDQLAALVSKMTDADQRKDDTLARAQKQLSDSQLDFIKVLNAGANARDTAVVDFVKARLGGTALPAPAPTPAAVTNLNSSCIVDRVEMAQVQRILKGRGYFTNQIDGLYGPITGDALERLQLAEKLAITRYPDRATLDHLGMPCNPAPSAGSTRAELAR
jgi:Putative peptidoglycan binding domain